MYLTDFH